MCIGKSAKSRAFKNIAQGALPVYYKNQKSSWMDTTLFKNWIYDEFVPSVNTFLKLNGFPIKTPINAQ
jgi:hypothetical protein